MKMKKQDVSKVDWVDDADEDEGKKEKKEIPDYLI